MTNYIALIHKDADSDYGVSFPDFPGCISVGSNLDEARAMAAEALALHVQGMNEDGDAIPEPSLLETVMRDRENREGVAVLVPLATRAARAVRINVTVPEDALREIDAHAEANGFTRSGFLVTAARRAIVEDGRGTDAGSNFVAEGVRVQDLYPTTMQGMFLKQKDTTADGSFKERTIEIKETGEELVADYATFTAEQVSPQFKPSRSRTKRS